MNLCEIAPKIYPSDKITSHSLQTTLVLKEDGCFYCVCEDGSVGGRWDIGLSELVTTDWVLIKKH